jgi:DDE superfamily endonuclease
LHWSSEPSPDGEIAVVTDNLSSHTSVATREWLAEHPRIRQVFIPKGACWLNLQEGWWRLFRRQALAGQCFADTGEIALATRAAAGQLHQRARPWVWGRPQPSSRYRRRLFAYRT